LYQYGPGGRLIEETDGQGIPLADYIYLGPIPVATLSPVTGQIYFLHNDRMATPQLATDVNQSIAWSAAYQPFGALSTTSALVVQDLRLPGQENDSDTGWYHNGHRDYLPGLGRYLESDPIGIAAGPNTYAYAGSNPVGMADPSGFSAGCPPTGDCFGSGPLGRPAYLSGNTTTFTLAGPFQIFGPGLQNLANMANFMSTNHPLDTAYVGIAAAGGYLALSAGTGVAAGVAGTDVVAGGIGTDVAAGGASTDAGASGAGAAADSSGTGVDPTTLFGHGGLVEGYAQGPYSPVTILPEETSMTFPTAHGNTISNLYGNAIETGSDISLDQFPAAAGSRTALPGSVVPDYTLGPPNGARILANPTTVNELTPLSNLLRPGMGNVKWAACQSVISCP
jgi:RHS repeat-associated protein